MLKKKKTEKRQYPIVFIHGMLGFGELEKINNILPYWGMFTGSLSRRLQKQGRESCAPSVSSLGSAWDRACEAYAQLTGTRVDYGKAHSEKYGHERYGRTYDKPMIPGWGSVDESGDLKKIHILGHSFGGATVRMFSYLMAYGSKEERAVTDPDDLSPFFAGGKGNWLQSVTTVAGPHNGTTVITAIGPLLPLLKNMTYYGANIIGNTDGAKYYDFMLDEWGVTSEPGNTDIKRIGKFKNVRRAKNTLDNLYYDLSLAGARELNKMLEINPDAYNFSISTANSMVTKNGNHRMKASTNIAFFITGTLVGRHRYDKSVGEYLSDVWLESDGCSNTVSALHPDDEPFVNYEDTYNKPERGVWNVMPVYQGDHGDVIGGSIRSIFNPYFVKNYYKAYFKMLDELD